jgi:hypothetical protein
MTKQPNLTGFPTTIFATAKRRLQAVIGRTRRSSLSESLSGYALMFEQILPAGFMRQVDPTKRQRSFGHVPVFWGWLAQLIEDNSSCQRGLALIQGWNHSQGLPVPASDTSSYCQARGRIDEQFLEAVAGRIDDHLAGRIADAERWQGLTLKAIDGSSVQLLDTEENQRCYPQPSSQKAGCGFPVMGMVGVLNLSHGGWEGFATCEAKCHDVRVAQHLLELVGEGDLLLGDRAFCSYELIARVHERGGHVLMRLHQARHRKLDWRQGKKISRFERLVTWSKPPTQPAASNLSAAEWAALPGQLTLRYIRMATENRQGNKRMMIVVTTLTDAKRYDGQELFCLYARRWEIELKLRDVKTTLNCESLAVQSPGMAHKTLWMMMIAYNLLRALMQQAASIAGKPVRHMSFKAILDLARSVHESFRPLAGRPRLRAAHRCAIIEICATKTIDERPFRSEPRAVKRRPKSYSYLTAPRHLYQEIPHRGKYRSCA